MEGMSSLKCYRTHCQTEVDEADQDDINYEVKTSI